MARRDCPETAVGADLLAAVALAVGSLRHHLADPDPKVSLRAVAELTKLLGVCARHGLAVGEVPTPVPPDVTLPATPLREEKPAEPSRKRERRKDDVPSKMPLPGGRGSQDPALAPPAQTLPPGGPPRLTSFLSPRPSAPAPASG